MLAATSGVAALSARTPSLSTPLLSTVLLSAFLGACDLLPNPADTQGQQKQARWLTHGRLTVDTDAAYTLVRLRADSVGVTERHDVLLTRFDFDPSPGAGDEHALHLALGLGRADTLQQDRPYALGPRGILAYATVTCLCRPLRPDSVRGRYTLTARGLRQLTGHIDATLYFTAWDDSAQHASYRLHQRVYGVRP